MQAAEDALNRAEAAEAEASSLRERLINAAAVPPPVAAAGYNASLEKELVRYCWAYRLEQGRSD